MIAPSMESDLYSLRLECAMLQKQVREHRKDAERYRWLRDNCDNAEAVVAFNEGAALDEQIDAEMSAAHPVPPNV